MAVVDGPFNQLRRRSRLAPILIFGVPLIIFGVPLIAFIALTAIPR
jgi:hypothetical protein